MHNTFFKNEISYKFSLIPSNKFFFPTVVKLTKIGTRLINMATHAIFPLTTFPILQLSYVIDIYTISIEASLTSSLLSDKKRKLFRL